MATRWRWPPESWCGKRKRKRGPRPTSCERLHDAVLPVGEAVDGERLGERRVDGVARVQRRVGVLEDHLHAAGESAVARHADRLAVEQDAPGRDRRQPADGAQHRRLARAGLADDAEGFARRDGEADAAHRVDALRAVAEHDLRGRRPRAWRASSLSRHGSCAPGRVAVEHRQRRLAAADLRQAVEQAARIGMARLRRGATPAAPRRCGPAYMTSTRSQKVATRLQVVADEDEAHAALAHQRVQDAEHLRCTVTSSAEVGSSAISRSGPGISIIAIMTRWPMPPESSCG